MTREVMDIENMRPATKEEMDAINKYIASISVDTGFSIWDLQEQVKVHDAYRNKGYTDGKADESLNAFGVGFASGYEKG